MGVTVTPKVDGAERYQGHICAKGPDGRMLRRSRYVDLMTDTPPETYAEALAIAERWAARELSPSLADCLLVYLDRIQAAGEVRPSTAATYRSRFINLVNDSDIAGCKPDEVTVGDVEDLRIALLEDGRSPEYVNAMEQALSSAYSWFIARGIARENPVRQCARIRIKQPRPRVLSDSELKALAGWMRGHATSPSAWTRSVVLGMVIALHTGMRAGEICALVRDSLDSSSCTLTVDSSVTSVGGHAGRGPTKSGKARTVAVKPKLAEDIARHLDRTSAMLGIPEGDVPVITATGGFVFGTQLSAEFSRVRDELGLSKEITFHKLRHTHATKLAHEPGIQPKDVQQRLGHADVKTTMDFYYQTDNESDRRMAQASAAAFRRYGV